VAKIYTTVGTALSESRAGVVYSIKRDERGDLSCDCRSWINNQRKTEEGKRTCKHIERFLASQVARPAAQIGAAILGGRSAAQVWRDAEVVAPAREEKPSGGTFDLEAALAKLRQERG